MKIILILLLVSFTTLMANDSANRRVAEIGQILPSTEEADLGCKALLLKTEKPSCSQKKPKRIISIAPIKISKLEKKKNNKLEIELINMRKEFTQYKKDKDREIEKIHTQLSDITKQFIYYKSDRNKKMKKVKTQLNSTQKQLSKIKKRLTTLQQATKKKRTVTKRKIIKRETTPIATIEPMPIVNNLPWVEIVVEDGLDIYQLALRYYKDRKEYKQIYVANRDTIGRNFKIRDGMSLKIPMTEKFEEQPMILNRY